MRAPEERRLGDAEALVVAGGIRRRCGLPRPCAAPVQVAPLNPAGLAQAADEMQNRFNFAAFACPSGWRMAYRYAARPEAEGFLPCTYDGYTNEGSVISLAAHLAVRHHVPIEKHWNSNIHRVRGQFAKLSSAPVVHSLSDFRAPSPRRS